MGTPTGRFSHRPGALFSREVSAEWRTIDAPHPVILDGPARF